MIPVLAGTRPGRALVVAAAVLLAGACASTSRGDLPDRGSGTADDIPALPPPVEFDGLTQVAGDAVGSSSSTGFPGNRRSARTAGGRVLLIYGAHGSGLQLVWRDVGGGWQSTTTGASEIGAILEGTGTGDWSASIAVAAGPGGAETAWVVWASSSSTAEAPALLRRLTDLDSASGPSIGPIVEVDPTPGAFRPDVAFETGTDGVVRGCVLYWRRTPAGNDLTAVWSADLGTDRPRFDSRAVLDSTSSTTRSATLVHSPGGLRVIARAAGPAGSGLVVFGRAAGDPLEAWWRGADGPALPTGAYPTGVALSSGEVIAAVEEDVEAHVTSVHRYSADGRSATPILSAPGFAQPAVASDGTRVWLVAVRATDRAVVSREWSDAAGWSGETVEIDPRITGETRWPNVLRDVDDRLRFALGAQGTTSSRTSVWWSQRTV